MSVVDVLMWIWIALGPMGAFVAAWYLRGRVEEMDGGEQEQEEPMPPPPVPKGTGKAPSALESAMPGYWVPDKDFKGNWGAFHNN